MEGLAQSRSLHSLGELGIDAQRLKFQTAPTIRERSAAELGAEIPRQVRRLTIAEAKEGLAAMLGVSIDQIDIVIRGRNKRATIFYARIRLVCSAFRLA